jgi:hypothetical protein
MLLGALSLLPSTPLTPRAHVLAMASWTGCTSASIDIAGIDAEILYREYSDLSRMTEWSPVSTHHSHQPSNPSFHTCTLTCMDVRCLQLLESVTVQEDNPSHSVWVMRVPAALKSAAGLLGYPSSNLAWEADLHAPGLPTMSWTSTLDEDGQLEGLPNVSFEPAGSVQVIEAEPGVSTVTLTLEYTLPDGSPAWQKTLVNSQLVQFILRSRMRAGLERFAAAMRREQLGS